MRRRGYTIRRRNGRGIARLTFPGRRVRVGGEWNDRRRQVSLGFVIVTMLGVPGRPIPGAASENKEDDR